MKFQTHIEGLRGIAVLSVVIYHLELNFFDTPFLSGGFLGVDIFFVISGYLITSIIVNDLDQDIFSFKKFYFKRLRRLFPALIFMVITIFLISIFLLNIKSFHQFLDTTISSLAFYSNILFFLEDSYYADPSRLKPLLHTWSLSVEEQFYLIYPFVLFYFRKNIKLIIITCFFVSLILSSYLASKFPSFNFYMLPSRLWEINCGSLIFFYNDKIGFLLKKIKLNLSNYFLIFLILVLFLFNSEIQHPSIFTLLPILLSALLIVEGEKNFSFNLLNNKVLRYFGKISYSLYLWHFPILVYLRIFNLENSYIYLSGALILIICVSHCSTYFIEERFRKIESFKQIRKLLFFALGLIFISVFVLKGLNINIFYVNEKKYDINKQKHLRWVEYKNYCNKKNICGKIKEEKDWKNILFVGDSIVPDIINITDIKSSDKINFIEHSAGGCPPIQDLGKIPQFVPNINQCKKLNKERFDKNFYKNIDAVLIGNLYGWYTANDLEEYVRFLNYIGIKKIIIFGNYLTLQKDSLDYFDFKDLIKKDFNFKKSFKIESKFNFENELTDLADKYNILFISYKNLCKKECLFFDNNKFPFTLDKFHFTYQFSKYLSKEFELKKIIKKYISN